MEKAPAQRSVGIPTAENNWPREPIISQGLGLAAGQPYRADAEASANTGGVTLASVG